MSSFICADCMELKRNYLCIEKAPKWAQVANERIAECERQSVLF